MRKILGFDLMWGGDRFSTLGTRPSTLLLTKSMKYLNAMWWTFLESVYTYIPDAQDFRVWFDVG